MVTIANKGELVKLLLNNGIRYNSHDCRDYEKAKHLLLSDGFIDYDLYDELIRFITTFIGV